VFFHNFFQTDLVGRDYWRAAFLFASAREDARPTSWHLLQGNKKAPTQDEKGRQNSCAALLIFPKPMVLELELAPAIEI